MSLENQIYIPTLKWHQSKNYVYLVFEVSNAIDKNIIITDNSVYFNVISNNNDYEMTFQLFENIENNESSYSITENNVRVILKKNHLIIGLF